MLMILMAVLGLIQLGRAALMLFTGVADSEQTNTFVLGIVCFAVAELSRRQSRQEPEPEKEVRPNRPHPLA